MPSPTSAFPAPEQSITDPRPSGAAAAGDAPESATRPARPARSRSAVWALLVRLHFYAGVFVAPFLFVAAFTGLLYTATPQLDRIVYGDELRVERVGAQRVPLSEQVTAARTAHPEGTLASVTVSDDPELTTRVVLSVPELAAAERDRTVFVDPYTGEVRGSLDTWFGSTPLTTWLDDLHRNLHLGAFGRHYSETAASWLWVVALGGLALWLGRRRKYRGDKAGRHTALLPDLSARGVRRTRGWHAATGVWLVTGLLILSGTGLTWSNYAGAHFGTALDALDARTPELDTVVPRSPTGRGAGDIPRGVSLDQVLAVARAEGLDGPVGITVPAEQETAYAVAEDDGVWPVRKDQVAVDPATGAVSARADWADRPVLSKLTTLGVAAHMGVLFGIVNQVLLAALALGLLCVIVWGYRMWWQRRPTRNGRRALVGAPPARGTWRQVPIPVLLVGVPVAALVGWALPLLGITLVVFLLVDALIGAAHRWLPTGGSTPAPSTESTDLPETQLEDAK